MKTTSILQELSDDALKSCLLEILTHVASYCERNHLTYFLSFGTLLGAIRHKGFIPWDDDIDIMMPRDDYNKFIQHFNSESKRYQVIDISTNPDYYVPFAKVVDKQTRLREPVSKAIEIGAFVDIFPIDNMGDDEGTAKKLQRKLKIYKNLLKAKNTPWHHRRAFHLNVACTFLSLTPISRMWLIRKIEALLTSMSEKNRKLVAVFGLDTGFLMNWKWFDSTIKQPFEGSMFNIPVGYDKILSLWYGNYMQLPPHEQQIPHHGTTVYRID